MPGGARHCLALDFSPYFHRLRHDRRLDTHINRFSSRAALDRWGFYSGYPGPRAVYFADNRNWSYVWTCSWLYLCPGWFHGKRHSPLRVGPHRRQGNRALDRRIPIESRATADFAPWVPFGTVRSHCSYRSVCYCESGPCSDTGPCSGLCAWNFGLYEAGDSSHRSAGASTPARPRRSGDGKYYPALWVGGLICRPGVGVLPLVWGVAFACLELKIVRQNFAYRSLL